MKFKTGDLIRGNDDSWRYYGITDQHSLLQVIGEKKEGVIEAILLRSDRFGHRKYEYANFEDLVEKNFHLATGKDLLDFNLKREIYDYNAVQMQKYKLYQENYEGGLMLNEEV